MINNIINKSENIYPPIKKNYSVIRYLFGNLVSYVGDQIYLVALPLMILAISGSVLNMGIIAAIQRIPNFLLPFIGPIIDNASKKTVMLVCDISRSILIGLIGILYLLGQVEIWHIYIVSLLMGIFSVFYNTAQFTILPNMVNRNELHFTNSIESSSYNTATLLGPTLGSIVISMYNPGYALIINSISFLIAFFMVLSIKLTEYSIENTKNRKKLNIRQYNKDLSEGFKHIFTTNIILTTNIGLLISTFGTTLFTTIMIIHLKQYIDLDTKLIGYLLSVGGIFAIFGSLITNILVKRLSYRTIFIFSYLIGGLSIVLFGITQSYFLLMLSNAIGIMAAAIINPCIRTIRQEYTPPKLLGRVQSSSRFMTWCLLPISAFLAGYISEFIGTSNVIILGGTIATFAFIAFLAPLNKYSSK